MLIRRNVQWCSVLMLFMVLSLTVNLLGQDVQDLMNCSLEELLNMEVLVASKKAMTLRESPGIITVVTAEEIQNSGARDLIDVLHLVPGISMGVDLVGATGISMRGTWAYEGKVLFMLDGQELNELLFSLVVLGNHYPVDHIKRIEVIRGPGSSIYGGLSEVGVINIITKGGGDVNGISAGVTYGQMSGGFARRNGTFSIGKQIESGEISLHGFFGQGNRSDQIYTDVFGDSYNMTDRAELNPLMINFGFKYKDLSVRFIYDKYSATSMDGSTSIFQKDYGVYWKSILGELTYDWKISDKLTVTPKLNIKYDTPWYQDDEPLDGELFYVKYLHKATRLKGNITASYDVNENINIIAGAEFYRDKQEDEPETPTIWTGESEIEYDNKSAFIQTIIKTKFANITVGGRYDDHSQAGDAFAPRFGLTKAFDRVHFKVLYSEAFRSPATENLNASALLDTLNNIPSLRPEDTQVIEMEVGYKLTPDVFMTANIYRIVVNDVMVYFPVTPEVYAYKNGERTGSKGLEMELRIRKGWGYVNLCYSYYNAKGINKTFDFATPESESSMLGVPQHKLTMNGSYKISKRFSVNPSIIYLGKRYGYNNFDFVIEDLVPEEYDAEILANIYFKCNDLFVDGLNVGFGVYDIFNSKYQFVAPALTWHAPLPGPSREFVFRLSYDFNFKE
ncbi:TonB-dependent receptor plug domain-containing protein [bacterium]|nr:TonB-dependent receptor plug domain-containing protein [bacterium]